jgi:hypothetical protein
MSMNPNNSATSPIPPKKTNTKTIIIFVIAGVLGTFGAVGIWHIVMDTKMNDMAVSSNLISGEYDTILRQKCIEKLNSYGLPSGSITEGSINLCVDTAKAVAYHELNK